MPDENEKTMRLRASETNALFTLYASLQEIDHAKDEMEKRLRAIPYGWRDISLIRSVLSKLIDQILETVPIEKLVSLSRNMRCMSYRVYFAPPVTAPPPDEVIVKAEDLAALAKYAHECTCIACDKNCNKCELGAALDHTLIQSRRRNESWSWIDCDQDYEDKDAIRLD